MWGTRGQPDAATRDVLRAALVLAVSALDGFLHDRIALDLSAALRRAPPPPRLLEEVKKYREPAQILKWMATEDPAGAFAETILEGFETAAFQNPGRTEYGVSLLGVQDLWPKVGAALDPPLAEADVRKRLSSVIQHRHDIVHRADSRKVTRDPIVGDIEFIQAVAEAIDKECEAVAAEDA